MIRLQLGQAPGGGTWKDAKGKTWNTFASCSLPMGTSWNRLREEGRHWAFQKPGFVTCKEQILADGRKIPKDRPFLSDKEGRGGEAALAITVLFPQLVWNHTFNAFFLPKGSLLVSDTTPVAVAFPLEEKVVNDEMIDLAVKMILSGKLDKISAHTGFTMGDMINRMSDYADYGKTVGGPVGAFIGAWLGGFVSSIIGIVGKQPWDVPDELENYAKQNAAIRNKAGINWHFSTDERCSSCANLWFDHDPRLSGAQYTLLDGWARLKEKLKASKDLGPTPATTSTSSAPSIAPSTALTVAAQGASCAFTVGQQPFPCTRQGFASARRAARTTRTRLLFHYGQNRMSLQRCVQVLSSGGTPIRPQAPRLRGLQLGALDRQNISTLTVRLSDAQIGEASTPKLFLISFISSILASATIAFFVTRPRRHRT